MTQFRPQPISVLPPVVKNLLIINALAWLAAIVLREQIDLNSLGGLHSWQSSEFRPFQFITHMFLHATFVPVMGGGEKLYLYHILFNMFALWMFGRVLESFWGAKRFLIYYMICGIGAGIISMIISSVEVAQLEQVFRNAGAVPQELNGLSFQELVANYRFPSSLTQGQVESLWSGYNTPMVGASGAIFGLLAGFGMLFPNSIIMLIFPPIPMKAKYFVIILGVIEVYLGFAQFQGDNVAHFAHVAGAVVGFIVIQIWKRDRKHFY